MRQPLFRPAIVFADGGEALVEGDAVFVIVCGAVMPSRNAVSIRSLLLIL